MTLWSRILSSVRYHHFSPNFISTSLPYILSERCNKQIIGRTKKCKSKSPNVSEVIRYIINQLSMILHMSFLKLNKVNKIIILLKQRRINRKYKYTFITPRKHTFIQFYFLKILSKLKKKTHRTIKLKLRFPFEYLHIYGDLSEYNAEKI